MAIEFEKKTYPGDTPAFWRGEAKMLPGGFNLTQKFTQGSVLYRGAFVFVDFDKMEGFIVKISKVLAGGTTTNPRVSKRHYLQIGDNVMKIGKSDSSSMVKSIDTTNPEYDVLELSQEITGLTEGDFLQESTEYVKDTTDAEPRYVPNMMLGANLEIGKGLPTLDVAYNVVVLKDIISPFPTDWLIENSPCLKTNPNIMFIKQ